jgi:[acyl-carrier-protein] S-malonyltransferase
MKKACQRTESGLMTTFVGAKSRLDLARFSAVKWCREKLKLEEPVVCDVANYLNAQCKVLGGNKEALDFIEVNFREFDIKRIKRLPVNIDHVFFAEKFLNMIIIFYSVLFNHIIEPTIFT